MSDKLQELEAQLKDLPKDDSTSMQRIELLMGIGFELGSGDDPQRLFEVCAELRELSKQNDYSKGEAYSLLFEGTSCCFVADHERGLRTVEKGKSMFEELGDEMGIMRSLFINANIHRSIGSFDQALSGLYEVLKYFRRTGQLFLEAYSTYDIGLLYHEIGNFNKALEHFRAVATLKKDASHRWLDARSFVGIGNVLTSMGDYRDALDHYHKALAIFKEIGHRMGEARALDDIGSIYMRMEDGDLALPFHTKSLELRRQIGQRRAEGTSLLNIARVHLHRRDSAEAISVLDQVLKIAEEIDSRSQIYEAHQLLSAAFELQGDATKALHHYKVYQQTKEQVFSDDAGDRIQKLQVAFEVEKAETEAEINRLKNIELNEKNTELRNLLKELQATQGQLVQSEKMAALGKLVAGLVHELNTPLGASNSAIDVSERCIRKLADLRKNCESLEELCQSGQLEPLLDRIEQNQQVTRGANDRLSAILGNLKSFVRLDEGERQAVDIHEGLESTLALLEHDLPDGIEIVKKYGSIPAVNCRPGEVNQVFMNLITNAIESIDGSGTVTVQTSAHDGHAHVVVQDTGVGIDSEKLPHIFDPGFSSKGRRVKAGIGLFVCMNIVQKHQGSIDVDSEKGKGTTVSMKLPIAG